MTRSQFIEAVEKEQEALRRFLCLLCRGDSSRADDLAQDTLVKAYLAMDRFRGDAKFSTWLFRIAYNCFFDSNRRKREESVPLDCAVSEADEDGYADRRFANEELYSAIEGLDDTKKALVLLFYMEDLPIRDIEKITGLSSSNIRTQLFRARALLKKSIENKR